MLQGCERRGSNHFVTVAEEYFVTQLPEFDTEKEKV
jgi:hypothetical protein